MAELLILTVIMLLAFWLFSSKSKSRKSSLQRKMPAKTPKKSSPYQAVSIKPCASACQQSRKVKGIKFLASKVSPLPLSDCTMNCTCSYIHYDDRRDGDDRRFPTNSLQSALAENDQRTKKTGRRQSD